MSFYLSALEAVRVQCRTPIVCFHSYWNRLQTGLSLFFLSFFFRFFLSFFRFFLFVFLSFILYFFLSSILKFFFLLVFFLDVATINLRFYRLLEIIIVKSPLDRLQGMLLTRVHLCWVGNCLVDGGSHFTYIYKNVNHLTVTYYHTYCPYYASGSVLWHKYNIIQACFFIKYNKTSVLSAQKIYFHFIYKWWLLVLKKFWKMPQMWWASIPSLKVNSCLIQRVLDPHQQ